MLILSFTLFRYFHLQYPGTIEVPTFVVLVLPEVLGPGDKLAPALVVHVGGQLGLDHLLHGLGAALGEGLHQQPALLEVGESVERAVVLAAGTRDNPATVAASLRVHNLLTHLSNTTPGLKIVFLLQQFPIVIVIIYHQLKFRYYIYNI